MTLPPIVVPLLRIPSDPDHIRTELVFAPDREGDDFLELITAYEGDGPSFVCTPATARRIAAELTTRADLLDARHPSLERKDI